MYSVTFMGCVFIIWYTQTTCMHITLQVCFLQGPTQLCFSVSFSELVLNSYVTVSDPCPSGQAATPCAEVTARLSAAVWHRPVATWVVGILDIVFLHHNASQYRGAISAASGSKQYLSHTEKSLLPSSPSTTRLSQHWDHNIHQATNARILQILSLSTCNASPEASCTQRQGLKSRLNTSRP